MVDSNGVKCDEKHNPWVHGGTSSYVNVHIAHGLSDFDAESVWTWGGELDDEVEDILNIPTTADVESVWTWGRESDDEVEDKVESVRESDNKVEEILNIPTIAAEHGFVSTAVISEEIDDPIYDDAVDGPDGPAPVADEQVLLLMQLVPCRAGNKNIPSLVFWDHGSTMGMITFSHAKVLKLKGWEVSQWVQVASKPWELWKTRIYLVPLVDRSGIIHRVKCFGVESITSKLEKVYIDGVIDSFP